MGNIEDSNQSPLRVRLQIFNQVSINGCVYIADTKEDVEKIFSKFIDKKSPLILTNKCQEDLIPDHHDIDYFKRFCTVDLNSVAGCFINIDIVETGEIGLGNKPVYEVWADLKILDNDRGKFVTTMFDAGVATFGMRSIVQSLQYNKRLIMDIFAYDLVNKKV